MTLNENEEKKLFSKIYSCYYCTDDPVIQDWLTEALQILDQSFPKKEYPDKIFLDIEVIKE